MSATSKVLLGVSGGRNSAVAGALLKSQGADVQGVYLAAYDSGLPKNKRFPTRCCMEDSLEQARVICGKLGIPLHVVNVEPQFKEHVEDYFVHQALQARVANPCIPCNLDVRFDALFEKAEALGCSHVATGHYAQVIRDVTLPGEEGFSRLFRGQSHDLEQSYFLYRLSQKQLSKLILPIGSFQDFMVEKLAKEFELPVTSSSHHEFACLSSLDLVRYVVESRSAASLRYPGLIKHVDSRVMGDHFGLYQYRLGQEVKLNRNYGEKFVVTGYQFANNTLVVDNPESIISKQARVSEVTWTRPMNGLTQFACLARLSPSQKELLNCTIFSFENSTIQVEFEHSLMGMQPGTPIVFYAGDEVLGGGYVETTGGILPAQT